MRWRLVYTETNKKNNTNKNHLVLTYQFQKRKINRILQEDWVNRNKQISISNQLTSQEDIGNSLEEVSVNNNVTFDITPFNPEQNLSVLPKLTPFQSSETHILFRVENFVGNKRKVIESKSEAGEVTLTNVIGNRNAENKEFETLSKRIKSNKQQLLVVK